MWASESFLLQSNKPSSLRYTYKAYPISKSVRGGAYDWMDTTSYYYRSDAIRINTYTDLGFRPALILQ